MNVLSFYPLPNDPGGPSAQILFEVLPADGEGLISSLRITREVRQRIVLNTRYHFFDDNRILPSVNQAIRSTIRSDSRSQNLSLILDSEITDSLFSQFRFSFGRTRLGFQEQPTSPFVFSASRTESVDTPFGPQKVIAYRPDWGASNRAI